MSKKYSKETIAVASTAGDIGKTMVASAIVENLRLRGDSIDAYVGDTNQIGLFTRYGDKSVPLEKNDPSKGVKLFDIRNPAQRRLLADALSTDSERIIFDLPADSISELIKVMGSAEELEDLFHDNDSEFTLVSPIAEQKSLNSYKEIKLMFPNSRHIAVINKGLLQEKGLLSMLPAIEAEVGSGEHFVIKQELTKPILEVLKDHSFREAYTPRDERQQPDGGWFPANSAYILQSVFDQTVLSGFISQTRDNIFRLFP